MTLIIQKALSLLQHPWVPAFAVGLLALLLCLARCARGRGKALDGGRTFAVFIILGILAVIWLTWGSSNPSLPILATIATAIIPIAVTWKQYQEKASAPTASNTLTIEKHQEITAKLLRENFQEEQKRKDAEQKLFNLKESFQEKLRLLEDSKEKLQQMAGSLPKQQLAEAEERLAQGDTALAEQLFDQVAAETGQTAAAALLQSGRLAEDRLDYSKALRNYTAAVALAPDNPDYLLPVGRMAYEMGDYQQAEEWLAHLLAIREQEGKEDVDLAHTLNELAAVYYFQGRHGEAELLHKRSLEIREQKLGKDHPDVAKSLNNLAALYDSQGRRDEAEPLYKRSLVIWEKFLGKEHPHVAAALNNLAALYDSQGRYDEAEPLHKRSLEIREQKLGKDHPDVAESLNNIALLYEAQGRYTDAEQLYQRALAILKAKFPNGHPNIDACQANYNTLKEKMQAR